MYTVTLFNIYNGRVDYSGRFIGIFDSTIETSKAVLSINNNMFDECGYNHLVVETIPTGLFRGEYKQAYYKWDSDKKHYVYYETRHDAYCAHSPFCGIEYGFHDEEDEGVETEHTTLRQFLHLD